MSVISTRSFQRKDPAFQVGLAPVVKPADQPGDTDQTLAMALLDDIEEVLKDGRDPGDPI